MNILRDFLKGSEKQNNMSFKPSKCLELDMERLIFGATLYIGITLVHKLNHFIEFCGLNVLKRRNSAVVFSAWSFYRR